MSRVGKAPIQLPDKVKAELVGRKFTATGPKGTLAFEHHPSMKVVIEGSEIRVERPSDSKTHKSLHGLTRALLNNMIVGVSEGFQKTLEIIGVGYRAELKGKNLEMMLGFSHPILMIPPPGIEFQLEGNNKITVMGIDKQLVGEIASKIRSFRPPEPYKGKGVKYEDEHIRRKAGKTAA
jgi:large subunit ribosomal protein L6